MKVKIIYENNTISFITQKDILIKDLLSSLKNSPKLNLKNQEFQLLDNNQNILQNVEIIKISSSNNNKNDGKNLDLEIAKNDKTQSEILLYLVPYEPSNSKKYESVEEFNSIKRTEKLGAADITDLIMKTTNAKEKISVSSLKNKATIPDRMRIFDFLNSNMGNLTNESSQTGLNSSTNHLNELLNILRPMIENDGEVNLASHHQQPRRVRMQQATVSPDENLMNNLKEMGFPEDQCRRALIASRNDISRATDLLLSDGLDYLPNEK